jgi:hypothetical protein
MLLAALVIVISSSFSGGAFGTFLLPPFVVDDSRQLGTFLSWSWGTYYSKFL